MLDVHAVEMRALFIGPVSRSRRGKASFQTCLIGFANMEGKGLPPICGILKQQNFATVTTNGRCAQVHKCSALSPSSGPTRARAFTYQTHLGASNNLDT